MQLLKTACELPVYHQLQAWLGKDLPSDQWGWEMTSIGYKPITMTCPPAPERLLKIIKFSCQGYCDSVTKMALSVLQLVKTAKGSYAKTLKSLLNLNYQPAA